MDKKYVVIETVSTFKMKYAVPVDDINMRAGSDLDVQNTISAGMLHVNNDEVGEIGQEYIGEKISGAVIVDEEQVLRVFDEYNKSAVDWTVAKKLNMINMWNLKEKLNTVNLESKG